MGRFPLSVAQQRLWFLEQLHGASPAYNIAGAFELEGRLDVAALSQSLSEIVRRHESLRTTFGVEPVQVVLEATAAMVEIGMTDLSGLTVEEREGTAKRITREEGSRPFDITADLLLRAQLLKMAERRRTFC